MAMAMAMASPATGQCSHPPPSYSRYDLAFPPQATSASLPSLPSSPKIHLRHSLRSSPSSNRRNPSVFCSLEEIAVGFPKPEVIEWQKDLANSVSLIGTLGNNVVIKYLDSGKVMAHCIVKVKRSGLSASKDDSVFFIQFWDELAEIAAAHLKRDDRVCITGSIWVESYLDSSNEQKTMCKVVARDLKFVGSDYRNEKGGQKLNISEQWEDYFENPKNYWDNRLDKRNPKAPDFKHKIDNTALWIDSKYTPTWVKDRLEDSREERREDDALEVAFTNKRSSGVGEPEKLWQAFFANPSDWWDNRYSKKNPKGPDFKHKQTGEALWIESYSTPSWVTSQLDALDKKAKTAGASQTWNDKTSFDEDDLSFF